MRFRPEAHVPDDIAALVTRALPIYLGGPDDIPDNVRACLVDFLLTGECLLWHHEWSVLTRTCRPYHIVLSCISLLLPSSELPYFENVDDHEKWHSSARDSLLIYLTRH
jgi:hypothetical protein